MVQSNFTLFCLLSFVLVHPVWFQDLFFVPEEWNKRSWAIHPLAQGKRPEKRNTTISKKQADSSTRLVHTPPLILTQSIPTPRRNTVCCEAVSWIVGVCASKRGNKETRCFPVNCLRRHREKTRVLDSQTIGCCGEPSCSCGTFLFKKPFQTIHLFRDKHVVLS